MEKFLKKYGVGALITTGFIIGIVFLAKRYPSAPGASIITNTF